VDLVWGAQLASNIQTLRVEYGQKCPAGTSGNRCTYSCKNDNTSFTEQCTPYGPEASVYPDTAYYRRMRQVGDIVERVDDGGACR